MYSRHKKFIWGFAAGTFLGGYVISLVRGLIGR